MEAAGLVLGAIPIGIWALEKYQEPFEAYSDYHNTINTLKANLNIQKMHLEATLSSIGLHKNPTPQELEESFKQKFPDRYTELIYIIKQMDKLSLGLMENLMVDINRKPNWTDEPPERASWEWRRVRRSFSTKKRDKIIQDLRNWNDDLKNLVEKAEVPAEDGSAAVEKIKLRYDRNNCDLIRGSLQALHRAIAEAAMGCEEASHQASLELDWLANNAISSPTFTVNLLHGSQVAPATPWRTFHADSGSERKSPDGSLNSFLTATSPPTPTRTPSPSRRTSILRKLIRPRKTVTIAQPIVTVQEAASDDASSTKTQENVAIRDLCAEIQESQSSTACFGSIHDPDSPNKGLCFNLSCATKGHPRIVEAIPLRTLLVENTDQEKIFLSSSLSAKQRYALASSLAKAVLYLSDSLWLGDKWDDEQVKLFLKQTSAGRSDLSEHPAISCLINKSSSSSTSAAARGHIGEAMRLIPNAFVFTLGILLVELAVNEAFHRNAIEAILQGDYLTLRRKLDKVYREAGSLYGNAAQRCVNCEFIGPSSQVDFGLPVFRQQFHHTVVAPLQATYEVFSMLYGAA